MQLTIRMPEEQMTKIEHIAKEMGLKKADVTRMAIKSCIEKYSDSAEKPFDKVKHLIGVAESGVPDLGQRHRKHLIRKIKGDGK